MPRLQRTQERKPLMILGVSHDSEHPSYDETLSWIKKNVKKGMRIGVEFFPKGERSKFTGTSEEKNNTTIIPKLKRNTVLSLEPSMVPIARMMHEKKVEHSLRYWTDVVAAIRERGGIPLPLEEFSQLKKSIQYDIRANRALKGAYHADGKSPSAGMQRRRDAEEFFKKREIVRALRSKHFLKEALRQDMHAAIMGMNHARHIEFYAEHVPKKVEFPGISDADRAFLPIIRFPTQKETDAMSAMLKRSFLKVKIPERKRE